MKFVRSFIFLTIFSLLFAGKPAGPGYSIGDKAENFTLKNVDGKMVSLENYRPQKGAIVIFDCNTCPVSKAYNDRIIALNKKYAPLGYPVIAINSNDPESSPGDSYDEMVKRSRKKGYDFPYLFDETQKVAKAFGATNTPHVFVLTREDGDFKVAYIGAIDNNSRDDSSAGKKYVEEAVTALLAGKPVPVSRTKALGCSIKWKDA